MSDDNEEAADADLGIAWDPIRGREVKFEEADPEEAFKKFAPKDKTLAWSYVKWDHLKEAITARDTADAIREDRRTVQSVLAALVHQQLILPIPTSIERSKVEKKYKITRKGVLMAAARHIQYEIEKLEGEYEQDPLKLQKHNTIDRGLLRTFHSMLIEENGSLFGVIEWTLGQLRPDSPLAQRITDFSSDPLGWLEKTRSPPKNQGTSESDEHEPVR